MSYSRNVQMHWVDFCRLDLSRDALASESLPEFVKKLKFPHFHFMGQA